MAGVAIRDELVSERGDDHLFALDDDPERIRQYLDENGFVVITGVLSKLECQETLQALEDQIRKRADKFRLSDPSTHALASKSLNGYGVIGKQSAFHSTLVSNRCKPAMLQAASIAYGLKAEKLLASHDRSGLYRATAGHPEFQTSYHAPAVHLDHGPTAFLHDHKAVNDVIASLKYEAQGDLVKENNLRHSGMCERGPYQSLLNLIDNRAGPEAAGAKASSPVPTTREEKGPIPLAGKSHPAARGDPATMDSVAKAGAGAATGGASGAPDTKPGDSGASSKSGPTGIDVTSMAGYDRPLGPGEDDGGHVNVPGFHLQYEEWYKERFEKAGEKSEMYRYIFDPKRKADRRFAPMGRRVPCPAGSLILWDVRLAHGGVPNRGSSRMRAVQFVSYFPRSVFPSKVLERRKRLLRRSLPKEAVPRDKVQRAVLGID